MAVGGDPDLVERVGLLSRQRIKFSDTFKFFAKERQFPCAVVQMRGPHFKTVAPYPERAALKGLIVAAILLRDQIGHDLALVTQLARSQILGHRAIGLDRPDAVDARDRGDDNHIVALQQRAGGRMAHPVDLLVNLALFLDIGVRARDIRLGLIVIVVAYKVLDRVIGKKALELPIKLGGQRLVRR